MGKIFFLLLSKKKKHPLPPPPPPPTHTKKKNAKKKTRTTAPVAGSCTAGGAYVPALSDEVVIVRSNGTIFLGGPPLVKAATGEDVSAEELGGGDLHTAGSGVADSLAESEAHAAALVRRTIAGLKRSDGGGSGASSPEVEPPLFDPRELRGVVPGDRRTPWDARAALARILDGSRFDEFKPRYGTTLLCGFSRIHGQRVGVLANNGPLFSEVREFLPSPPKVVSPSERERRALRARERSKCSRAFARFSLAFRAVSTPQEHAHEPLLASSKKPEASKGKEAPAFGTIRSRLIKK